MATYQFETPDGRILERDYPMGTAPTLGSQVELDGVLCTRVISDHVTGASRTVQPFTSMQLPPWEPGAKRYDTDPASPFYGQPMFASKAEAEEFSDRSDGKWKFNELPAECEGRFRADQKQSTWDRFPVVDASQVKPEDLVPDVATGPAE